MEMQLGGLGSNSHIVCYTSTLRMRYSNTQTLNYTITGSLTANELVKPIEL